MYYDYPLLMTKAWDNCLLVVADIHSPSLVSMVALIFLFTFTYLLRKEQFFHIAQHERVLDIYGCDGSSPTWGTRNQGLHLAGVERWERWDWTKIHNCLQGGSSVIMRSLIGKITMTSIVRWREYSFSYKFDHFSFRFYCYKDDCWNWTTVSIGHDIYHFVGFS
jgi:hypothetical protein